MAVRGSVSMNFGGSRTTQMLSEVFCSSLHWVFALWRERERKKRKK
jgi:hypothetical protein